MISKISYTEEGGLYTQLDGEPTDIGYNNTERLIVLKLNEVIDELNELAVCKVDKKPAPWPPESAKKEDVTPEPSQQVQNVTQGKPGCNPKKEETPGPPDDRTLSKEEVEQLAVEAYKNRLVERLRAEQRANPSNEWAYGLVIRDIEETV